jgi:AhpC/TSA family
MDTRAHHTRRLMGLGVLLIGVLLVMAVATPQEAGRPLAVGEPAPDFTLPSTTGDEINLSEFRGKKHVLLEFYGVDFAPT